MKNGFVKVATITPKCKVADTTYNGEQIRSWMKEAAKAGAMVTVFPELCITGYSCSDLFLQRLLLKEARIELQSIAEASGDFCYRPGGDRRRSWCRARRISGPCAASPAAQSR